MPRQGGQGKGKPKMKDKDFGKALIKRQIKGLQGEGWKHQGNHMNSILDNSALDDFIITTGMEDDDAEVVRVHNKDAFLIEPATRRTTQNMSFDQFHFQHLVIPRKPNWNKNMTAEDIDRQEKIAFLEWRRGVAALENNEINRRVTPFEKNLEVWRQLWRVIDRSDLIIQIVDARNPLLYYTEDLMKYAAEHRPPRKMIMIVNKADFLTDYQRWEWGAYLASIGVRYAFYSAHLEQDKIDKGQMNAEVVDEEEIKLWVEDLVLGWNESVQSTFNDTKQVLKEVEDEDDEEEDQDEEDDSQENDGAEEAGEEEEEEEGSWEDEDGSVEDESEDDELDGLIEVGDDNDEQLFSSSKKGTPSPAHLPTSAAAAPLPPSESWLLKIQKSKVLTRGELLFMLHWLPDRLGIQLDQSVVDPVDPSKKYPPRRFCVGMVGYPNVGKSSVINTLLGVSKSSHGVVRVGVSSTPGKTKHFQTLVLSTTLMLCDCPGLVFPSFMNSTGEMVCAGILPINQMRDYIEPATVISSRIPRHLLEAAYGMRIDRQLDVMDDVHRPPTAHEMLSAYCAVKGYITNGTGRWDEFRACKELLRDFTDGRILFVTPPPKRMGEGEGMMSDYHRKWLEESEKTMLKNEKVAERVVMIKLKEQNQRLKGIVAGGPLTGPTVSLKSVVEEVVGEGEEDFSHMVFGDVFDGNRSRKAKETAQDGSSSSNNKKVEPVLIENQLEKVAIVSDDGEEFEFIEDDDSIDGVGGDGQSVSHVPSDSVVTGEGIKVKREHKKLKHWGKKNKKLRDKNPYGEESGVVSYVAYCTNRPPGVVGKGEDNSNTTNRATSSSEGNVGVNQKKVKIKRQDPRHPYGVPYVPSTNYFVK